VLKPERNIGLLGLSSHFFLNSKLRTYSKIVVQ